MVVVVMVSPTISLVTFRFTPERSTNVPSTMDASPALIVPTSI